MNKLKALQPWQIIAIAIGALILFAIISYFIVVQLTSVKPPASAAPVPANLDSEANRRVTDKLQYFEVPRNLPLAPQPVETPDPNNPSTVNPFRP